MPAAVIAALCSAFCFALAAALQHREALGVQAGGVADVRLLWKLCHRPLWLIGVVADLGSMGLHILALSLGTLALVQPLGVTGILFAVPLAAVLRRQRPRRNDLLAGLAVVAGLTVLLKSLPTAPVFRMPGAVTVLLASLAVLILVAGVTAFARIASSRGRAILLAVGAGVSFGMTAVLVRILMLLVRHHGRPDEFVVASVAIAALGLFGYLLLQSGYRAGHFAATVATTTVLNPVVAVLAGGVLLHEGLPSGVGHFLAIGFASVVVCIGIALLVRSPVIVECAPAPHPAGGVALPVAELSTSQGRQS